MSDSSGADLRWTHGLRAGAAVCLLLACSDSAEPLQLGGSFALATIDARSLPADIGPVGPTTGTGGGLECRVIVPSGALTIDSGSNAFVFTYEMRNSCSNSVLSRPTTSGTFTRSGTALTFASPTGSGVATFNGVIEGSAIRIEDGIHTYVFRRA